MAEAVIGALRVNLGMDTAQFQKGVVTAQTGLTRLQSTARITGRVIGTVFASAIGIVMVSAARAGTRALRDATVQSTAYKSAVEDAQQKIDAFSESLTQTLAPALGFAARNMDLLAASAGAFAGLKIGAIFGPWGAAIGAVGGALTGYAATTEIATEKTRELRDITFEKFKTDLQISPALSALTAANDVHTEALKKQKEEMASAEEANRRNIDSLIAQKFALDEAGQSMAESVRGPMEQYRAKIEEITQLQNAGAISAQVAAKVQGQAVATLANEWFSAAGAVTGALAQIFKDNKAFAVANAVVNTAEAITSALKNPPGPPFSYVYAAAAAASGAAQIAAILSAQPGSSKKPSAKSGGGGAAATGGGGGGRGQAGPSQAVTIVLRGEGGFSRDQVRGLREQLIELSGDSGGRGLSFA